MGINCCQSWSSLLLLAGLLCWTALEEWGNKLWWPMAESLKWGVCPDAQWWFHCSRFPAGGCPFQRPRRSIHLRHHICSAFQFSMKIYSNIIANEMDSVPTISIIHFVFHIRACPVFVSKKLMISQAGQLKPQEIFWRDMFYLLVGCHTLLGLHRPDQCLVLLTTFDGSVDLLPGSTPG